MDSDAWQSDIAPADGNSIAIPPNEKGDGMNIDDSYGGSRTPERRRSSRSASPRRGGDRGRSNGEDANPGNNLHVSGLSRKVDTRDLEEAFSKAGRVVKASVMYDPHSRESRGFGFVTMETSEEADAAITALNGTDFMGKQIKIEKARRGRARTPTPGKYHGPTKRSDRDYRPYNPRPYDSRYRDRDDDRRRRRDDYDDRDRDRDYRRRDDRDRDLRRDRDRDYERRDDRRY